MGREGQGSELGGLGQGTAGLGRRGERPGWEMTDVSAAGSKGQQSLVLVGSRDMVCWQVEICVYTRGCFVRGAAAWIRGHTTDWCYF
jgi:hypothetical protein